MIISAGMRLYQYRNGFWYVALPGNVRRSLKTRDAETAQRLFKKLKRDLLRKNVRTFDSKAGPRLSVFIKDYLKYCQAHKRPSTAKRDEYSLKKLKDYVGDIPVGRITPKKIDDFHAQLMASGLKKSGVAITARHVRAALSKAVSWYDEIKSNPYDGARTIKIDPEPPRIYTDAELGEIFAEIKGDPDFHELITVYLLTGLRRSELFFLQARDLDFAAGVITVRMTKTRWRTVPMEGTVARILEARAKMRPVGRLWSAWNHPDRITHRWVRLMRKLKMKGRLHDLRHSFATRLASSGEAIQTIQGWLGHSDISTTMVYAHLVPDQLRRSLPRLKGLADVVQKSRLAVVAGGKPDPKN